jgi:predicted nucleotidyltransferase
MPVQAIELPRDAIAAFCRRHRIRRLSVFGSVLRDDFRPNSDVDVLIEFEPGAGAGLIRLGGMEIELGELLGRTVDLNTPGNFRQPLRDEIVGQCEVVYEAG